MGSLSKLNSGCKVCVHSSIIISPKTVKADKQKEKAGTILWQTGLDDAFHQRDAVKMKKKIRRNADEV